MQAAIRRLQSFVDRWWYFPAVSGLAAADLFIMVVPTDALLVSSVMLRPRKWLGAAIRVALGSAVGALAFAATIQLDAALVTERLFPDAFESSIWKATDAFFDRWGGVALFLIACSPLVQFPAVGIAALAGMPLTKLFLVCLAGRFFKSLLFAWVASHAPKLLLRLPFMRKELSGLKVPKQLPPGVS